MLRWAVHNYIQCMAILAFSLAFQFRKRRREDKNDGSQTNLTKPAYGLSDRLRRRIVEICSSARQRKAKVEMWLVQRLTINRRAEPIVWTVSICDLTTREVEAQRVSTTRRTENMGYQECLRGCKVVCNGKEMKIWNHTGGCSSRSCSSKTQNSKPQD
jgi:hypothetical protein